MAQGKKSFVAYSDWKEMFDNLPNEVAGELIKHIFAYVNDENPQTDNYIIKALFSNIRNTLKRDLDKWESRKKSYSEAGIESGRVRKLTSKPQVYVIRIFSDKESFIKIGITRDSVGRRFSQGKGGIKRAGYSYEIVHQFFEENLVNGNILELEEYLHKHFENQSYTPLNKFGGCTECFNEIILNDVERCLEMFNKVEQKGTVSDSVSVSVSDNVNVSVIKEKEIPVLEDFINYALEMGQRNNLTIDPSKVSLKYSAWKQNGWKDGNGKIIKNWKSKILHNLNYWKQEEGKGSKSKIQELSEIKNPYDEK